MKNKRDCICGTRLESQNDYAQQRKKEVESYLANLLAMPRYPCSNGQTGSVIATMDDSLKVVGAIGHIVGR